MALTPAQRETVRADILASADPAVIDARTNRNDSALRDLYNQPAVPAFPIWRTNVNVNEVSNAIDWSKYTPTDPADGTAIYTNRLLLIQSKQINLQTLLRRDTIDASKINIRGGLRDAVIALPAGAAGGNVSAGGASGVDVLNACVRNATRTEKLLAAAMPPTLGGIDAGILTFEGSVSVSEISDMLNQV